MLDDEEHGEEEAEVADAVDDEGFFACVGCGFFTEVETDEEVRGEAYAFPADEEEQEVGGEDEDRHEEHEEVEIGEEAPVTVFMRHIAGGVEMDEEADAGDDGQHDESEVVDGEGKGDLEAGDGNPWAGDDFDGFGAEHVGPEHGHQNGGNGGEEQGDGSDGGAGQAAAQGSVEQEAEERGRGDEPEIVGVHWVSCSSS